MPKRLLDDSFLTSLSVAKVSPRAQDAFPRFILLADDFGCFEVIPRALAAKGWVYRRDVSEADVMAWLEEYVAAGMACLWTVNERRYCYLTGWHGEHGQKHRAEYDRERNPKGSKRRTPAPPADLVEAVKAGLRRDRDGLPPGVDSTDSTSDREVAGNEPGASREAETENTEEFHSRAGNGRDAGGKSHSPGHFPGSAVPVAVPVPVPGAAGKPSGLPSREQLLASQFPATALLLDALVAAGEPGAWPKDLDTRAEVERLVKSHPESLPSITAAVAASIKRLGKRHLGWHRDAMREAARPTQAPTGPVAADLAWLDLLTPERRAEAQARLDAIQADIETSLRPEAASRAFVGAADMVRQEFMS